MDTGLKLEHLLRHLKYHEPAINHWQDFGDVGRCMEIGGVLANAGALGRDAKHLIDGLTVAVHLLAKTCRAMEQRIARLEESGSKDVAQVSGDLGRGVGQFVNKRTQNVPRKRQHNNIQCAAR